MDAEADLNTGSDARSAPGRVAPAAGRAPVHPGLLSGTQKLAAAVLQPGRAHYSILYKRIELPIFSIGLYLSSHCRPVSGG